MFTDHYPISTPVSNHARSPGATGRLGSERKRRFQRLYPFRPLFSTTTYLIDMQGRVINQWKSDYEPGQSAYFLRTGICFARPSPVLRITIHFMAAARAARCRSSHGMGSSCGSSPTRANPTCCTTISSGFPMATSS